MQKNFFKPIFLIGLLICILASANATNFAITAPGASGATTSNQYTLIYTPALTGLGFNMDKNTISCYADTGNTVYNKTVTITTGYHSDTNRFSFNTFNWVTSGVKKVNPGFYIWCQNDQNTDQNAYSSGKLTLTWFASNDLGSEAIDLVGGLFASLAGNSTIFGALIAITIILVIAIDIMTGAFGIIEKIKGITGKR